MDSQKKRRVEVRIPIFYRQNHFLQFKIIFVWKQPRCFWFCQQNRVSPVSCDLCWAQSIVSRRLLLSREFGIVEKIRLDFLLDLNADFGAKTNAKLTPNFQRGGKRKTGIQSCLYTVTLSPTFAWISWRIFSNIQFLCYFLSSFWRASAQCWSCG